MQHSAPSLQCEAEVAAPSSQYGAETAAPSSLSAPSSQGGAEAVLSSQCEAEAAAPSLQCEAEAAAPSSQCEAEAAVPSSQVGTISLGLSHRMVRKQTADSSKDHSLQQLSNHLQTHPAPHHKDGAAAIAPTQPRVLLHSLTQFGKFISAATVAIARQMYAKVSHEGNKASLARSCRLQFSSISQT